MFIVYNLAEPCIIPGVAIRLLSSQNTTQFRPPRLDELSGAAGFDVHRGSLFLFILIFHDAQFVLLPVESRDGRTWMWLANSALAGERVEFRVLWIIALHNMAASQYIYIGYLSLNGM
ncbi:hypothetical protein FS749_005616 [Ceratobasidium sp. UAMH 11750]|nr:hypothetical protein FS749_005616 [Ceratobasidium sp. UAMH 11750]